MSGLDGLNIFGKLTNINRSKVDFRQADINGDMQVDQNEFKNIQSMCSIDSITFSGVDKNGDGIISESEWKTIQVGMDLQKVLNALKGAISRELGGVDSILQEELAGYLAQKTNEWATVENMNLDNAKDVFSTYINNEMQNWLNANSARRPSVIIGTVANELLNGNTETNTSAYLDSTQSDYHQRLITDTINSFARSWMESHYTEFDNAADMANALRTAIQAYMSQVVDEQNGTTRLDKLQQDAIAHEVNTANNSVTSIQNSVTGVQNTNTQHYIDVLDNYLETANGIDVQGNAEAQEYLNELINAINTAKQCLQNTLAKLQELQQKAEEERQLAQNATSSKEAAEHAKKAAFWAQKASKEYSEFREALQNVNELSNLLNEITTGIENGTTPNSGNETGGTRGSGTSGTSGAEDENTDAQTTEEKLNAVVSEFTETRTFSQTLTRDSSLITAVENNAKNHVNSLLDNIAASMRAKGLTESWISAALTTTKEHYRSMLTNIYQSFTQDGIVCTYRDLDPDRGGPRGEILNIQINAAGVAEYYKSEYLKLDPNHNS